MASPCGNACLSRHRIVWLLVLFFVITSTLFGTLSAFIYQTAPSADSCWVVPSWTPGVFKEDQGNWYTGLAGTDFRLAWEEDSDFEILHTLYVAAVVASASGLLLSVREWQQHVVCRGASQGYIAALTLYFVVGFTVNVLTQISFAHNRCYDHNAHYLLPANAIPATARFLPREGWTDISDSLAKFVKGVYLTASLAGSFLTNTVLQQVLLLRACKIGYANRLFRCLKCAKISNIVLLLVNIIALPVAFCFFMRMMDEGAGAVGGVANGDMLTVLFNVGAAIFVTLHSFTSIALLVAFATLPKEQSGQTCLLPIGICIIILSTLCCYGNMVMMLENAYILTPIDSVINSVCMIIVSFARSSKEEAHLANDEKHLCDEGNLFSDSHTNEQNALPDAVVQAGRRPSTHSVHSAISSIGEAFVAISSLTSQHKYESFQCDGMNEQLKRKPLGAMSESVDPYASTNCESKGVVSHIGTFSIGMIGSPIAVSEEYRPSTPRVDAHTPVLLAPGTPMLPEDDPPRTTPGVTSAEIDAPRTPGAILDRVDAPRTPQMTSQDAPLQTKQQPHLPEISDGLLKELRAQQRKRFRV